MVESDAFRNGRYCGRLISKPRNPYPTHSAEADDWEAGFVQGRRDLAEEFAAWKKEQENKEASCQK
jgi:hypothetical protein